jgi:hypothetical protein
MLSFCLTRYFAHSVYFDGVPVLQYTESIIKAFKNETKVSRRRRVAHMSAFVRSDGDNFLISSGATDLGNTTTVCCLFIVLSHSSRTSSPMVGHPRTHQAALSSSSHPAYTLVGITHRQTGSWLTPCVVRLLHWSKPEFRTGRT